jgi:hypothetical protein
MTSGDIELGLRRDRHFELHGREAEPWIRRVILTFLAAVVIAALAGAFGQQHTTARAESSAATLTVAAPQRVRGGLFFQGRIDIVARRAIAHPRLILGPGWTEQMQLNTIEPSPTGETSRAGRLQLAYDSLHAGDQLTVWAQFEANPTGVGHRDRSLTLLDGDRTLARVPGTMTTLP